MIRSAIAALLCAATALAQQPQPQASEVPKLTETMDIRVINVDVSAIDPSGKAVTDLTRDDFEVLEDNQPQKITNLTVMTRTMPAAAEPRTAANLQLRRRVILLVDNNYIDKTDRDTALRTVDDFVDTTFDGSYEWAMGMIGQQLQISIGLGVAGGEEFVAVENGVCAGIET